VLNSQQPRYGQVTGFSRVEVKKFKSLAAAEAWILPALICTASSVPWYLFPDGLILFSSLSASRAINPTDIC